MAVVCCALGCGSDAETGGATSPTAGEISEQASPSCVALPGGTLPEPVLGRVEGCATAVLLPLPQRVLRLSDNEDVRALLVGRWQSCDGAAGSTGAPPAGLEFRAAGRVHPLQRNEDGSLSIAAAPAALYRLLGSGQFLQSAEVALSGFSASVSFDGTLSVLQLASDDPASPPVRYVRVAAESSAAGDTASNGTPRCSMVGVWDTAPASDNPMAFAFNERGEWFGGEWGSDLCEARDPYGSYDVYTPEIIMDNFDFPSVSMQTHTDESRCAFWRAADFVPIFGDDCNSVYLELNGDASAEADWDALLGAASDGCAARGGYLKAPGDELLRRLP